MVGYYDYDGLIKEYLTQSRSSSKTAGNRLSFKGVKLYSYDSLLAELDLATKVLYIDKDISHYSRTTSGQTRRLMSIAEGSEISYYRIDLEASPDEVLNDYINDIYIYIGALSRARINHATYEESIENTVKSIKTYMELHKIDKRKKPYKRWIKLIQHLFQQKLL